MSETIYVLLAVESDYESSSTALLFADLSPDKLEKIKALAESISLKHKAAYLLTMTHMQQWEKQKGNKRLTCSYPEPPFKLPRNREKRVLVEKERAVEFAAYNAEIERVRLLFADYNTRWTTERTRFFNENLNLTDEEAAIYPTVENHAGSSFEIEEVPTP